MAKKKYSANVRLSCHNALECFSALGLFSDFSKDCMDSGIPDFSVDQLCLACDALTGVLISLHNAFVRFDEENKNKVPDEEF